MTKTEPKSPTIQGQDAIALLTADHKTVKSLFKQFEALKGSDDANDHKAVLVKTICNELKMHTQVEEEIFYPAVREAIDADDLMDEADVEHASAKELIAQLDRMAPGADHYDAMVTVLGEYIDHHVKEEEGEMFPKARKGDIDGAGLGEEITARKAELKAELSLEDDEVDSSPAHVGASGRKKTRPTARK